MNRKEFIQSCSYSCLAFAGISTFLDGCTPVKSIQGVSRGNEVQIRKDEFTTGKTNKFRRYLTLTVPGLNYPLVVYRFSPDSYSALLLRCPHQGSELNVHGDLISCPAHGSEFTNRGEIIQGPADQQLNTYSIRTDTEHIYIKLS